MFSHQNDINNAFIDIKSGAGGTDACDWTSILLRQYLKYCEKKKFKTNILECSNGEIIGFKSITIKVEGKYAYGYLKTETGIHRLVRKSPFNSSHGRHTSFSSVFVYPEIDDSFDIKINLSDIRIDTFRSSGAGGQHVNKTDSAVRITHIPTGISTKCQNDRSQHRNKLEAMIMLKSKLFEEEVRKRKNEKNKIETSKAKVAWGNQIRSYIFDKNRIKDIRTNLEIRNIKEILDGNLDQIIMANLKLNL